MKTVFLKGLCGLSLVMIPEVVFSSSKDNLKSVSPHQYTHLIETYQSQTFGPLSQPALFLGQAALNNSYKTAGVYFITNKTGQQFSSIGNGNDNTFNDPTGEYCARYGFEVTNCASGLFNKACPYNDKIYDKCCDASYKYTKSQCSAPKKLSADACGDKYQCYCDTSTYPYTSCDSPKIKGSACTDDNGTRYSSCSCPTSAATPYGCETYYASPCNSVCQKAYADNCRNRTAVQTPYGCEKYFSDCSSKCEKAYTDNCRNRTAVSAPYGCEKYFADCASKCEIAKIDNCANKTAVSTPYGCKKTFDDCPSKCEIAYTDNCRNRTAVIDACPIGATCTYFSDCASKIQSWECRKSLEKLGNVCQFHLPILYGDGTVSKEYPALSDKTPIGIVFDTTNRLAMALTDVKQDGSAGSEEMLWSEKLHDIPDLENCPYYKYSTVDGWKNMNCGTDGRANTDKILACGANCGKTPAATACNLYEPIGCTKDFCKKTKWFLPSAREGGKFGNLETKTLINYSIDELGILNSLEMQGTKLKEKYTYYWSSTEYGLDSFNTNVAWAIVMERGIDFMTKQATKFYIRPIVKY